MDPKPPRAPSQEALPLEPLEPTPRKCEHGTFVWVCPWPSCPLGAGMKRRLRQPIRRDDGTVVYAFFRRRMRVLNGSVVFDWAPE